MGRGKHSKPGAGTTPRYVTFAFLAIICVAAGLEVALVAVGDWTSAAPLGVALLVLAGLVMRTMAAGNARFERVERG